MPVTTRAALTTYAFPWPSQPRAPLIGNAAMLSSCHLIAAPPLDNQRPASQPGQERRAALPTLPLRRRDRPTKRSRQAIRLADNGKPGEGCAPPPFFQAPEPCGPIVAPYLGCDFDPSFHRGLHPIVPCYLPRSSALSKHILGFRYKREGGSSRDILPAEALTNGRRGEPQSFPFVPRDPNGTVFLSPVDLLSPETARMLYPELCMPCYAFLRRSSKDLLPKGTLTSRLMTAL